MARCAFGVVLPLKQKYLCAIGSLSAGPQTRSTPSAVTA
jgi:hypothetical protein